MKNYSKRNFLLLRRRNYIWKSFFNEKEDRTFFFFRPEFTIQVLMLDFYLLRHKP
jgi:hypothetical protein